VRKVYSTVHSTVRNTTPTQPHTPHTHTLYASRAVAPDELSAEERPDLSALALLEENREGFEAFSARTAALPGERKKIKNIKKRDEKKEVIEEWSKVLDKIGDEVEKYGIERDKNIKFWR
jgi:hypothetical protein